MAIASEAGELLAEYRWVANTEVDTITKSKIRPGTIRAKKTTDLSCWDQTSGAC